MKGLERMGMGSSLRCAVVALYAALGTGCDDVSEVGTGTHEESLASQGQALSSGRHDDGGLEANAVARLRDGRRIFRYDTFGDEIFWGGELRLHEAIAGAGLGGVGAGVSPATALALGLKVDVDALPHSLRRDLRRGRVDLTDPATTLALLKLDAVIGLTGFFADTGELTSVGIQCALCHTAVDDSFAPGIGRRLDGWPNRDLDVGGIIAAAPNLSPLSGPLGVTDDALRAVLQGWGRGKFDAFVMLDGKATRPDGGSAAQLIPPLFGLEGVGLVTWNGWSGIGSWVPLVAVLELRGQGTFSDRRLADATQFPVAAAQHFDRVRHTPDLVTSKLPALLAYIQAIEPPRPPEGSYDAEAAVRGEELFNGKARCSNCHVPPLNTTPGWNIVPATTIGIDSFQADRSPNHGYRPPPLHALFTHEKGGFFHDGRFPTLPDVVAHFNAQFTLDLTADESSDLVQFLKSL
jgi:mono/diheme cytochrome c family protein